MGAPYAAPASTTPAPRGDGAGGRRSSHPSFLRTSCITDVGCRGGAPRKPGASPTTHRNTQSPLTGGQSWTGVINDSYGVTLRRHPVGSLKVTVTRGPTGSPSAASTRAAGVSAFATTPATRSPCASSATAGTGTLMTPPPSGSRDGATW